MYILLLFLVLKSLGSWISLALPSPMHTVHDGSITTSTFFCGFPLFQRLQSNVVSTATKTTTSMMAFLSFHSAKPQLPYHLTLHSSQPLPYGRFLNIQPPVGHAPSAPSDHSYYVLILQIYNPHDLSSYLINHRRLLAKMLCIHNTKIFLPQNHSNTYYNFPDILGLSNSESSQARSYYLHWSQHCLWSFHNSSFSSEHFQQTMTFSASPPSKGKQNKTIPTYPCPS